MDRTTMVQSRKLWYVLVKELDVDMDIWNVNSRCCQKKDFSIMEGVQCLPTHK